MDYHTFLRRIPKVELHCHLEGTVRASTFADLATKNNIELPEYDDPSELYSFNTIEEFFVQLSKVSHSICEPDDFRRVTYEALEDGVADGLRYREMFWNPQLHMEVNVPYETQLEGIVQGIADAENDFNNKCRMISNIAMNKSSREAVEIVEKVIEHRCEEVIGIGMDNGEKGNPPSKFVEAYKIAKNAGYHLCGHTGQVTPASNIEFLLDELGCERIDHGYSVVLDDRISKRCFDEGIIFTVCATACQIVYFPWDMSKHPIHEMINRGLKVVIGSDDPPMCWTSLGLEYILIADHMQLKPTDIKQLVLNGVDGCWLDESEKRKMLMQFTKEIDDLIPQIEEEPGLRFDLDNDTYLWELKIEDQPGLRMLKAAKA